VIISPEKKQQIAQSVVTEFREQGITNPTSLALFHCFRKHYKGVTGESAEKTMNGYTWFIPIFNKLMSDSYKDTIVELLCELQDQIYHLSEQNEEILRNQAEIFEHFKRKPVIAPYPKKFKVALLGLDSQYQRQITDRLKGKGVEFDFCGLDKEDFSGYDGIIFKNKFPTSSSIKLASRYSAKLIENGEGGINGMVKAILERRDER
jgi:hypothetical protein